MGRKVAPRQKISAWQVGSVYIGTVVGAGFASGQEILQFFGYFGLWGLAGLALASSLFFALGKKVMLVGFQSGRRSYREVIDAVGGRLLGPPINWAITFFLFGILVAMVAGTGAVFEEEFALPPSGAGLMAGWPGSPFLPAWAVCCQRWFPFSSGKIWAWGCFSLAPLPWI